MNDEQLIQELTNDEIQVELVQEC